MDRTFFIYQDFEVYSVDEFSWRKERHRHNFFELLFIEFGKGTHTLNSNLHKYKTRDIYFLTPSDVHSFKTSEPTRFHCLRFLPGFFNSNKEVEELKKVFYYHNRTKGSLALDAKEEVFCEVLILKIVEEVAQQRKLHDEIVRSLMLSLLKLIQRNVTIGQDIAGVKVTEDLRVDNILRHIRANIANPHELKKKILADRFNVSVNYIGEYIKKQLNVSLREYIEQTKMRIITEKLMQSNLTFSEIGNDLGFTDSSHFYRFVLRNTGKTPSAFRESLKKS